MPLHFDGGRVSTDSNGPSVQAMCDEAMAALENPTSLCVKIVEKPYLLFRDLCGAPVERFQETVDPELLRKGNCTPLAVVRLVPSTKFAVMKLLAAQNHKNTEAMQCGSRCYGYLLKKLSIWATPRLGLELDDPDYFLHMEHDGNPRCITCRISVTDVVELWDGERTNQLRRSCY